MILENIELTISKTKIEERIEELAKQIEKDFEINEEIIIICVLKGAFIFTADLVRKIRKQNCIIEFIKVSSYGSNTVSSGNVKITNHIGTDITNKNVIIVEDILDTGLTLSSLTKKLKRKRPKVLKTCVLLDKKSRRKIEFNADYVGFEIPDKFVIGYGLDYDEKYRDLESIVSVV